METKTNFNSRFAFSQQARQTVQDRFFTFHAILGLYLTDKCNCTCSHCGEASGPWGATHLDISALITQIPPAVNAGILGGLHVSGGEPFLFPSDLERLGALCERLGILFGINTNAFWATSPRAASEMLETVPGVTQLLISTDVFHEEFIPIKRVKYALLEALERNLCVTVSVCTAGGKPDNFVDRLLHVIGDAAAQRIVLGVNPIEPYGRAATHPDARRPIRGNSFPDHKCFQLNRPVIMEDGSVFACCNTIATQFLRSTPLHLGNINEMSLENMYHTADHCHVIQALRTLGPKFFAEELVARGHRSEVSGKYGDGDICRLCIRIVSNAKLLSIVRETLDCAAVRKDIAVIRAGELNEPRMLFDWISRFKQEDRIKNPNQSREHK